MTSTHAEWARVSLAALVVAVAGAGVSIAVTRDGSSTGVATTTSPPTQPTTTAAVTTTPVTTTTVAAPPTTTRAVTTVPATPGKAGLAQWPAKGSGWTVVLGSYAHAVGRASVEAIARRAAGAGLPQVGVLDSSGFSSLNPGYYVVFSGAYGDQAGAEAALAAAHAKGFANAYPRHVRR